MLIARLKKFCKPSARPNARQQAQLEALKLFAVPANGPCNGGILPTRLVLPLIFSQTP
jgi:hypothetical protein